LAPFGEKLNVETEFPSLSPSAPPASSLLTTFPTITPTTTGIMDR
jgi:hypothetical protein